MPFVEQYRRVANLNLLNEIQPGDLCYIHYKRMVDQWRANPRWTTAHEIYRDLMISPTVAIDVNEQVARRLAWQVFFQLHVIPYELQKRDENGDI